MPARGNFKDFNLKKEILRKIAIPDEERKAIGLHENAEDKRIEWDVEKEKPLAVEFSGDEMEYRPESLRTHLGRGASGRYVGYRVAHLRFHSGEVKPSFLSAATLLKRVARSYSDVWSGFLLKYRSSSLSRQPEQDGTKET